MKTSTWSHLVILGFIAQHSFAQSPVPDRSPKPAIIPKPAAPANTASPAAVPSKATDAEQPVSRTTPDTKVKVSTKTRIKKDYTRPSGIGSDYYVGLLFGSSSSAGELGDSESPRSGIQSGLRGSAAIFSGSFGLAAGLGFFYNSLTSKDANAEKYATLGTDDTRRKKDITSSGVFVEFFPHFRPNDNLQIGPEAHIALAPYRLFLPGEDNKSQTIFAGLRAAWETVEETRSYRFGFEYLIDINIEPRSIQNIVLSFDLGFPIKERFTKVVEKKRIERRREIIEKTVEKPVEKTVITKQVSMVFDQQSINFVTAKAELLPASQIKIQNLAKFLSTNRLLWTKVIIEGHTDRRGEYNYNMKLSLDRAISVGQELARNGVDPKQISWQGFGPTRPIDPTDNELAWARNRRVEIKFDGVTDEAALKQGVNQAMQK
jgi:outer membrane protein OmpA-like peptidoglycan-associated protein